MSDATVQHYASESAGGQDVLLDAAIIAALKDKGLDHEEIDNSVLAESSADEFHAGGADASRHLFKKLGIQDGEKVVDLGCGLGGPARQVASMFPKCTVEGVDFTPKFVQSGQNINAWKKIATQLAGEDGTCRITLQEGDITQPTTVAEGSIDRAYTIHVAMNIKDKAAYAREVYRVLKPGGRFAIFEQMANPLPPASWSSMIPGCGEARSPEEIAARNVNEELPYPLPWAVGQQESFCETPEKYVAAFTAAGMREVEELREDRSEDIIAWMGGMKGKMMWHFISNMTMTPPALGPGILMGPTLLTKVGNFGKAITNRQLLMMEMVFEKPAA